MAEYIERAVAAKQISDLVKQYHQNGEIAKAEAASEALYRVAAVPAADVATVKHGYWAGSNIQCVINSSPPTYTLKHDVQCSVCGQWTGEKGKPYCPNCGAKMIGGADNVG